MATVLRRLLFFYQPDFTCDAARLTTFGLWILRGSGTGRKGSLLLCETFCAAAHDSATANSAGKTDDALLMARRVRSLMALAMKRLERTAELAAGDVHALDCGVLLVLTDASLFGGNAALRRSFYDTLLQHGLMRIVGMYLQRQTRARTPVASKAAQACERESDCLFKSMCLDMSLNRH